MDGAKRVRAHAAPEKNNVLGEYGREKIDPLPHSPESLRCVWWVLHQRSSTRVEPPAEAAHEDKRSWALHGSNIASIVASQSMIHRTGKHSRR
jgi:hypothetical protein